MKQASDWIALNAPHPRDVAYALHPYTNEPAHEERGPIVIDSGKGTCVFDDQGTECIEALAGLCGVAVGYGEERLVKAAAEHSFPHKVHLPSIDLAKCLG